MKQEYPFNMMIGIIIQTGPPSKRSMRKVTYP